MPTTRGRAAGVIAQEKDVRLGSPAWEREPGVGEGASGVMLRKDAVRNRRAILEAARDLFARSSDVSMCEVARHAGVGQATLYRNFPDRTALAAEVLRGRVEDIEKLAVTCAGKPGAFFVLLRHLVESTVDLYALGELAREDAGVGSHFERCRARVMEVMQRPLADAKAAGALRGDTSLDDVFLVLLMARGAMQGSEGAAERATAARRALTLALNGLAPSGPV